MTQSSTLQTAERDKGMDMFVHFQRKVRLVWRKVGDVFSKCCDTSGIPKGCDARGIQHFENTIGHSSNGKIRDSKSFDVGSIPTWPAT